VLSEPLKTPKSGVSEDFGVQTSLLKSRGLGFEVLTGPPRLLRTLII